MKASKTLNLLLISSTLGVLFGYHAEPSSEEDVQALEQKALEIIRTSTNMKFLKQAQKDLEVRKYAIYNAKHDRVLPVRPTDEHDEEQQK